MYWHTYQWIPNSREIFWQTYHFVNHSSEMFKHTYLWVTHNREMFCIHITLSLIAGRWFGIHITLSLLALICHFSEFHCRSFLSTMRSNIQSSCCKFEIQQIVAAMKIRNTTNVRFIKCFIYTQYEITITRLHSKINWVSLWHKTGRDREAMQGRGSGSVTRSGMVRQGERIRPVFHFIFVTENFITSH